MKKGDKENRELAFKLYKEEHGRNIGQILRRLEAGHGLRISAQTLHKWKREEGWERRMTDEGPATLDERLLGRLLGLMGRYERQMEGGERLNDQSVYAYLYLIKAARELSRSVRPEKADPDWRRRVAETLEREYGIKRGMD